MYCVNCGEKIIDDHHKCIQPEVPEVPEVPQVPQVPTGPKMPETPGIPMLPISPKAQKAGATKQKNLIIGLGITALLLVAAIGVGIIVLWQMNIVTTFAKQVDTFEVAVEKNDLGAEEEYYTDLLEKCHEAIKNKDKKAMKLIGKKIKSGISDIEELAKENEAKVFVFKKQLEDQDATGLFEAEINIINDFKNRVQTLIDGKEYAEAMKTLKEWEGTTNKFKNTSNYYLNINQVDVSNYPTVKLYLEIQDHGNGCFVEDLKLENFYLSERADSNGDYIKRQITKAVQLDQVENININLVADVSGSMIGYPLNQAKNVMQNFIRTVQFQAGDKISLISFAESVHSEVPFSSDQNLLMNTINRLNTGDMTAFYDALYVAINQTAMESGAKCIIAFTDGMDNYSQCTPEIVQELATRYGIPIFIIGVGEDINTGQLDYIASSTGGFYRHISDISSMAEIYNAIYEEQKDVYLVEYETDQSKDKLNTRDIYINYLEDNIVAKSEYAFIPAILMETTTSFSQLFTNDFIIFDSNTRYLTVADLRMLTPDQLRLARNEIYARQGRMFLDQGLQSHFGNLSWYTPSIYPEDFSENIFNDYERANAYFIRDYENLNGFN